MKRVNLPLALDEIQNVVVVALIALSASFVHVTVLVALCAIFVQSVTIIVPASAKSTAACARCQKQDTQQQDALQKNSYEITTDLPRQLSTAIGDGMEIFLQADKAAPNKSAIDLSFAELRATLADIRLITDKPLVSKGTSMVAQKSWQELGDQIKTIQSSTQKLGLVLGGGKAAGDLSQAKKLAREITDSLMTIDDPRNIVVEE